LVQLGFQDGYILDAQTWTVVILIVATLIGTATAIVNSSPSYALVLVWAFFGIYSRHASPFEWNLQYPSIILATQILIPVLGVVSVLAAIRWLRGPVLNSVARGN
jgi:ABC-type iron transport system FetAB permease component